MTATWHVDYTTPGFRKPEDGPPPEPVVLTEEQAEYAAATAQRERDEARRRGW